MNPQFSATEPSTKPHACVQFETQMSPAVGCSAERFRALDERGSGNRGPLPIAWPGGSRLYSADAFRCDALFRRRESRRSLGTANQ